MLFKDHLDDTSHLSSIKTCVITRTVLIMAFVNRGLSVLIYVLVQR